MNKLVSVIVPVYNVESYLKKCIDSILAQTYENYELILVDDGSTDQSGEICDVYAKADSRIKVIHQNNRGLVVARQIGLKNSIGQLIMPVDSDDWIDETMLEVMVGYHENYDTDIVLSGVIHEHEDGRSVLYKEDTFIGYYELGEGDCQIYKNLFVKENTPLTGGIRSNLWSRLYTRENIYDNQMDVDTGIKNGEDDACFFPCMMQAKSVYFIQDAFYHCRVREGSMSRDGKQFGYHEIELLEQGLRKKIKGHFYEDIFKEQLNKYIFIRMNSLFYMQQGKRVLVAEKEYCFPHYLIPERAKIIIYGAGAVGKDYVKQVLNTNLYELVGWIDKNAAVQSCLHKVETLDILLERHYEYIILATTKEEYAKEMKDEIRSKLKESKPIIWIKPVTRTNLCMR